MISGGKVESHVQGFSEGTEKMGNKLRTSVRGNMGGNTVFGEHVENEQFCEFCGGNGIMRRNENSLLGESVDNNEDGVESGGCGEFLDEVHGNRIPREFRNWELLEFSIWTMTS
jgi:hypothetical protein